jgi:prepilin-type N-terminal cleavage/methylation domain-containing protein
MTLKKAFTLIELLVVIAIIAILAAILFPVFAQAKAAAKKAATLSNIKQNATAVQIYLSDNDDVYPQSAYGIQPVGGPAGCQSGILPQAGCQVYAVYDALMPYTKNRDIFTDTAEPQAINWPGILAGLGLRPNPADVTSGALGNQIIIFAGMVPNFALFEDPSVAPTLGGNDPVVGASQLEFSADTIMFSSGKYQRMGQINPELDATNAIGASNIQGVQPQIVTNYRQPVGPFSGQNFVGTARHSEQTILNFADGHAKSFRRNFRFPDAVNTAPDTFVGGAGTFNRVYNLPFDINGIPNFIAEPRS